MELGKHAGSPAVCLLSVFALAVELQGVDHGLKAVLFFHVEDLVSGVGRPKGGHLLHGKVFGV